MRTLLLATDAWYPTINGIVRTLEATVRELRKLDIQTTIIEPSLFENRPCPFYPEICLARVKQIDGLIEDAKPGFIHIATEGPIGRAVRGYCVSKSLPFTTSYQARFPEYLKKQPLIPSFIKSRYFRWFHEPSQITLAPTRTIQERLISDGFGRVSVWSGGVDTSIFRPYEKTVSLRLKPIFLYVGCLTKDKNLDEFLDLPFKGTFWVVGDGPDRARLERKYAKKAAFFGSMNGNVLAQKYSNASVFVSPSRSDTIGFSMLESLACGTPVAAYSVPGPADLFTNQDCVGYLAPSLGMAVKEAIHNGSRTTCSKFAQRYSWESVANQFASHLVGLSH